MVVGTATKAAALSMARASAGPRPLTLFEHADLAEVAAKQPKFPPGRRHRRRRKPMPRDGHQRLRARALSPPSGCLPGEVIEPAVPAERVDWETGEVLPLSIRERVATRKAAMRAVLRMDWDASATCLRPYGRELFTPPEGDGDLCAFRQEPSVSPAVLPAITTTVAYRCRRCAACRMARAGEWLHRIVNECAAASARPRQSQPRSWLMTLTMEPEWHDHIRLRTIMRFDAGGKAPHPYQDLSWQALKPLEWEQLTQVERDAALDLTYRSELKLFFQRIRDRLRTQFRYVCVREKHDGGGLNDGQFHWHLILHEQAGQPQLRQDEVEACWVSVLNGPDFRTEAPRVHGRFARAFNPGNAEAGRICSMSVIRDPQGAGRYALKYVLKDAHARIAASRGYGGQEKVPVVG